MGRRLSPPVVLSIGGFDPSGGAGVTADLRTAVLCGCSGASALTALTVQGPSGVLSVRPLPPADVFEQIVLLSREMPARAAKTGMLARGGTVSAVARAVREKLIPPPVVDPVLVSSSGVRLLDDEGRRRLTLELLPLAAVVTPNLHEASALTGLRVTDLDGMERAARRLREMGAAEVIVTGGHLREHPADLLLTGRRAVVMNGSRLRGRPVHGLGCAFSTALACGLARGLGTAAAARKARALVRRLIRDAWAPRRGGRRLPGFVRSLSFLLLLFAVGLSSCRGSTHRRLERLFQARDQGPEKVIQIALPALRDPAVEVRSTAAWMLAETGSREIVQSLVPLLSDPAPGVRAAVAGALCRFPDGSLRESVEPLARDPDAGVRIKALQLLRLLEPAASAAVFVAATGDENPEARLEAVRGLAASSDFPALPELAKRALDDADWRVREAAIVALGGRREEEALSLVLLAQADSNPLVRARARGAAAVLEAAAREAAATEAAAREAAAKEAAASLPRQKKSASPKGSHSRTPGHLASPPEKPN